jgi:hypothetical protein
MVNDTLTLENHTLGVKYARSKELLMRWFVAARVGLSLPLLSLSWARQQSVHPMHHIHADPNRTAAESWKYICACVFASVCGCVYGTQVRGVCSGGRHLPHAPGPYSVYLRAGAFGQQASRRISLVCG